MNKSVAVILIVAVVTFSSLTFSFVSAQATKWTCATPIPATCSSAGKSPNVVAPNPAGGNYPEGRCPKSYWGANTFINIKDQYNQCADDGTACCADPCTFKSTVDTCLAVKEQTGSTTPFCVYMPVGTNKYACIAKYKLCLLNKLEDCTKAPLCEINNATNPHTCDVKARYTVAEISAATLEKCPALHGVVIAFLILMFLSLVGAIIFVIVVVIVKQAKADEEDKKLAEAQAAAEAAGKDEGAAADF